MHHARRHLLERSLEVLHLVKNGLEIPTMAILDIIAAQVALNEATDTAATAKLAALAAENTSLKTQLADLTAEAANAQALADRLKAANEPLAAAVAAAV